MDKYERAATSALADLPARLSALVIGDGDAPTDEAMREAEEETGLFDELSGHALIKGRYFYRIRVLAEETLDLIDSLDGTNKERRRQMEARARDPETAASARKARVATLLGDLAPA